MDSKKVILTITGKKFGKNFISYNVFNVEENSIVKEGKVKDYVESRALYKSLLDTHGEDNVMLLQK